MRRLTTAGEIDYENMTDEEVDAKVLKRLKRKPIGYDELREQMGIDESTLRYSLYRMATEDGTVEFDYDTQGWMLKPRTRKLTRGEALQVLMDAADMWANELTEYIIPAEDRVDSCEWEDNASTTANRQEQVERIYEAVQLLSKKKEQP